MHKNFFIKWLFAVTKSTLSKFPVFDLFFNPVTLTQSYSRKNRRIPLFFYLSKIIMDSNLFLKPALPKKFAEKKKVFIAKKKAVESRKGTWGKAEFLRRYSFLTPRYLFLEKEFHPYNPVKRPLVLEYTQVITEKIFYDQTFFYDYRKLCVATDAIWKSAIHDRATPKWKRNCWRF